MNQVRLALIPTVLGMETAWLFAAVALASMFIGMPQPALAPYAVAGLLAAAWSLSWLLQQFDWPLVYLRLAGVAVAVLAVTAAAQISSGRMPAPWDPLWFIAAVTEGARPGAGAQALLATAGALAIWQRGVRLALRDPGFDPVLRSFRLGLTVVAAEAVVEAFLPPGVGAAWDVLPFFALGLLALSLAHLDEVGRAHGGPQPRWLWLPPAVIVSISALAAALALGLYSVLWGWLMALLSQGERAVTTLFYAAALIVGLFAEFLVELLRWLIARLGMQGGQSQRSGLSELLEEMRRRPQPDEAMFTFIAEIMKYTAITVIAVVVLLWLAGALGRRQRPDNDQTAAERETLWSERTLGNDLQALLARLRGAVQLPRRRWSELGDDARAQVLRSYLESVDQAEQRGAVRRAEQTAQEFAPDFAGAFPGAASGAAELTSWFEEARYGATPPSPETARAAAALGQTLRAAPKPPPRDAGSPNDANGAAPEVSGVP